MGDKGPNTVSMLKTDTISPSALPGQPLLLFPPFADPTWPYVALPTLKGYLRRRGIEVVVRDLNIEGLDFLQDPGTMAGWRQRLTDRFRQLNNRRRLSLYEQMEYWRVAEAVTLGRDAGDSFAVMRDARRFYQQKSYLRGRNGLEEFFRLMEAVFFPFRFGFNRANHLAAPWDFDLLDHYITGRCSPFDQFYRRLLADLAPPPFVGLSLTFVSQIPETFYLCRLLREYFPACFIMLGGPCIDQIIRNGTEQATSRIFDFADAVGMQEGEKTLEELLPLLSAGNSDPGRLAAIPNLIMKDPASGAIRQGPAWTLDLADGAAPDYSDLGLDRYLAPARLLLYSPTRGCYWNKCSFCCYGFNQSGRHLYREIPVAQAVADLRLLQEEFKVSNFYLSCDVLAPAYAIDLARRIIAEGLDIRWSTDLRIEASYTPENCRLLYQAGLRAVAFGIESGADRVLRLMNKGIKAELIRRINRNFHQAGIATSWMTFLSHPGETGQEAMQTLDLIETESAMIDQFIVANSISPPARSSPAGRSSTASSRFTIPPAISSGSSRSTAWPKPATGKTLPICRMTESPPFPGAITSTIIPGPGPSPPTTPFSTCCVTGKGPLPRVGAARQSPGSENKRRWNSRNSPRQRRAGGRSPLCTVIWPGPCGPANIPAWPPSALPIFKTPCRADEPGRIPAWPAAPVPVWSIARGGSRATPTNAAVSTAVFPPQNYN